MRLLKTSIHAIGPLSHVEIDFTALPRFVAVTGENGSGKSALLEAAICGAAWRDLPTHDSLPRMATARDSHVESILQIDSARIYQVRHLIDAGVTPSPASQVVVLDGAGLPIPALPTTSVDAFDKWAKTAFPPFDVLTNSTLWLQEAGGLLAMTSGGRRAVILRALGAERLGLLAKAARARADAAKEASDHIGERMADEAVRGGNPEGKRQQLADRRAHVEALEADLAAARATLADMEARRLAHAKGDEEVERLGALLAAARERAQAADARCKGLLDQVQALTHALADADAIRDAVIRMGDIEAQLATLSEAATKADAAQHLAAAEAETQEQRERAASREWDTAGMWAMRAGERLRGASKAEAEAAAAVLPDVEARLAAAKAEVDAAWGAKESMAQDAGDVQEERIVGLRANWEHLRDEPANTGDAVDLAISTLQADDTLAAKVESDRQKRDSAEARFVLANKSHANLFAEVIRLRQLALRLPDLTAAEEALAQAKADMQRAKADVVDAQRLAEEAHEWAVAAQAEGDALCDQIDALRATLDGLRAMADRAPLLATAEAQLAVLQPQIEAALEAHAAAVEEADAIQARVPPMNEPADLADLPTVERDVTALEWRLSTTRTAAGAAEEALRRAEEAMARTVALAAERGAQEETMGDCALLADGLKAVQAAIAESAGPELAEVANELLHDALGPRWTLRVDPTRPSADRKREVEGYDLTIIDSETGRTADARTYSPGQRALIGAAVADALTTLACRRCGIEAPTLVRDESGAALSEAMGAAWVRMLRRTADAIGASQVLIVTHSPVVRDLCDVALEITGGVVRVAA